MKECTMRLFTSLFGALVVGTSVNVSHAEPIPVTRVLAFTEGGASILNSDIQLFTLEGSGPGFSLHLWGEGGPLRSAEFGSIDPSFAVTRVFGFTLQIGGDTITSLGRPFTFSFQITGPRVPIELVPHEAGVFTPQALFPFALTGLLSGTAPDGTEYRFPLTGQGRGRHFFFEVETVPQPGERLGWNGSNLAFESSDPVPEPATLVLVATGMAALWRASSKKSRARLSRRTF
jgi:hypothetical protein